MSFSPDWLGLREPADHASVNAIVRDCLRQHFAGHSSLRVVDLGCGAGSNLRGTSPVFDCPQTWTLVDYDAKLLAVAKSRLSELGRRDIDVTFREVDLSTDAFDQLLDGANLVTAAALFDLVSVAVIDKLVDAIARRRQVFFTVLSYDGIASWIPEHSADGVMRSAFNTHQTRDKGFGPAAGPGATGALANAFARHGYKIVRGSSPWVLDRRYQKLRQELDAGFAGAVTETGDVPKATVEAWAAARNSADNAVTIIGHEDLIALP